MQYCHLGRAGVRVSRLCLGTFNFGTVTDEPAAQRILDAALDAGINFLDTANHYPDFVHCGLTEEIIGRWFAQRPGRRAQVVLATKVYQPMGNPADPNDAAGLSKYKIRRHLEDSLRRLRTDHVDLYQMHHVDRRGDWEELWEAFDLLVQQGKVGYVGASNFAGWDLALAQAAARARHCFGLASEQPARGASAHDVMRAGNWKTVRMAGYYSRPGRAPSAGSWQGTCEQPGPGDWEVVRVTGRAGAQGTRRPRASRPRSTWSSRRWLPGWEQREG